MRQRLTKFISYKDFSFYTSLRRIPQANFNIHEVSVNWRQTLASLPKIFFPAKIKKLLARYPTK